MQRPASGGVSTRSRQAFGASCGDQPQEGMRTRSMAAQTKRNSEEELQASRAAARCRAAQPRDSGLCWRTSCFALRSSANARADRKKRDLN